MIFHVRLYLHHDNDLIQLHLNGVRLGDLFAKALEAHYKKEQIRFILPGGLELKQHKGRIYRIKVTLNDKSQKDLIKWVLAFPEQYKCHCIKNIARSYLGTAAIDFLNGMMSDGTWSPETGSAPTEVKTVQIRKKDKDKTGGISLGEWLDQVSASRLKTKEQKEQIAAEAEKIRNLPVEAILGTGSIDAAENVSEDRAQHGQRPNTAESIQQRADTDTGWHVEGDASGIVTSSDGDDDGSDDFDASLFFEQIRAQ